MDYRLTSGVISLQKTASWMSEMVSNLFGVLDIIVYKWIPFVVLSRWHKNWWLVQMVTVQDQTKHKELWCQAPYLPPLLPSFPVLASLLPSSCFLSQARRQSLHFFHLLPMLCTTLCDSIFVHSYQFHVLNSFPCFQMQYEFVGRKWKGFSFHLLVPFEGSLDFQENYKTTQKQEDTETIEWSEGSCDVFLFFMLTSRDPTSTLELSCFRTTAQKERKKTPSFFNLSYIFILFPNLTSLLQLFLANYHVQNRGTERSNFCWFFPPKE